MRFGLSDKGHVKITDKEGNAILDQEFDSKDINLTTPIYDYTQELVKCINGMNARKKDIKKVKGVDMSKIQMWCDGGCRGNQDKENIGAWGVVLKYRDNVKEMKGTAINTTNNKMELQACIEGLKAIKNKNLPVEVILDSQYCIKGNN